MTTCLKKNKQRHVHSIHKSALCSHHMCMLNTNKKRKVCSSWSMHIFTVPPSQQLLLKCVSEVAAMESQPRAHLFKRWNNEFFVASHLAITINLGFRRYVTLIRATRVSRLSRYVIPCKLITCAHVPGGAQNSLQSLKSHNFTSRFVGYIWFE